MTLKYLYVYILKCADGSYYTGITNNPEQRLKQHNEALDKSSYTSSRIPVQLVYCEPFADYKLAIDWETRIKKWAELKRKH